MPSNKSIRPSANPTRKKILKHAQKLFVKTGYSATSISQIANSAQINQSLIYHHFGNKEGLWKQVKANLLDDQMAPVEQLFSKKISAKSFISKLLQIRFDTYEKKPAMLRMIQWQQMEGNDQLFGTDFYSMQQLIDKITHYQQSGEICCNYPAIYIVNLLLVMSAASYNKQWQLQINTKEEKQTYLRLIIDSLIKAIT